MMKKISLSPLLLLLLFSYMLIEGSFLPLWIFLFSLLHEGGHLLATLLLGKKVRRFGGRGHGFSLSVEGMSYKEECLVAAAGPAVSFLLAGVFWLLYSFFKKEDLADFSFANAGLGLLNLLPVPPLDGGRVLFGVLALYVPIQSAEKIMLGIRFLVLLPLLGLSVWQFLSSGYNLSLLLICIYLISLMGVNTNDV